MRRIAIALSLALVAGCEDDGEPLVCVEASEEITRRLEQDWTDPNACTSDDQCVTVSRDILCPDERSSFGACEVAVHVDSVAAFEATKAEVAEDVCPRTNRCMTGPSCIPWPVRCAAFECRSLPDSPCLSACEARGCGECAARCIVDPVCVASASSCDEILTTCDSAPMWGRLVWGSPYDETRGCLLAPVVVGILDEPLLGGTGDLGCGVGPDDRAYLFTSGTLQTAAAFPDCSEPLQATVYSASYCE